MKWTEPLGLDNQNSSYGQGCKGLFVCMTMASNSFGGKYPGEESIRFLLYTSSIKKGRRWETSSRVRYSQRSISSLLRVLIKLLARALSLGSPFYEPCLFENDDSSAFEHIPKRHTEPLGQRGKNSSAHTVTHHYKWDKPSILAIIGSGMTKPKDTKETNPTKILTSHSAQHVFLIRIPFIKEGV